MGNHAFPIWGWNWSFDVHAYLPRRCQGLAFLVTEKDESSDKKLHLYLYSIFFFLGRSRRKREFHPSPLLSVKTHPRSGPGQDIVILPSFPILVCFAGIVVTYRTLSDRHRHIKGPCGDAATEEGDWKPIRTEGFSL